MAKPNIVFWDLETLPNLQEALKVWPQLSDFPGRTLKADICSIICFGYKTSTMKRAKVLNAWDSRLWRLDVNYDYEVVKAAHKILNDADIIVTHNGKKFDFGFLNTRIAYWRAVKKDRSLTFISKSIPHVDTCLTARQSLFLFSNKLNRIAKLFKLGEKEETGGWPLWVDVHGRKASAMRKMSSYCAHDVELTEEAFLEIQAISNDIPNMNLFSENPCCPRCAKYTLQKDRVKALKSKMVQRYYCKSCGGWSQTDLKHGFKKL